MPCNRRSGLFPSPALSAEMGFSLISVGLISAVRISSTEIDEELVCMQAGQIPACGLWKSEKLLISFYITTTSQTPNTICDFKNRLSSGND